MLLFAVGWPARVLVTRKLEQHQASVWLGFKNQLPKSARFIEQNAHQDHVEESAQEATNPRDEYIVVARFAGPRLQAWPAGEISAIDDRLGFLLRDFKLASTQVIQHQPLIALCLCVNCVTSLRIVGDQRTMPGTGVYRHWSEPSIHLTNHLTPFFTRLLDSQALTLGVLWGLQMSSSFPWTDSIFLEALLVAI